MIAASAVTVVAFLLVAVAVDVGRSHGRAWAAADAAALAAVAASPLLHGEAPAPWGGSGEDASTRAAHLAARNGGELVACDCDAIDHAEVTVRTTPDLALVRRVLPQVRAHARAELRPRGG